MIEYLFFPEHLNKEVLRDIFIKIGERRNVAKKAGDMVVSDTLKLARNGPYGLLGSQYSWLFDHKARLSICANGQLMLAMLVEKFFQNNIKLLDINTDGTYIYLHKSQRNKFQEIIKWWEDLTKMKMEQTKFEKIWFLNTADYFGTYYKKDKLETKCKGIFLEKVELGKGMEFPIIAEAVKNYFLNNVSIEDTIYGCKDILKFCAYRKLKKGTQCFHNLKEQQRVNRFFACLGGAYLYSRSKDEKTGKIRITNMLKSSGVELLNFVDNKKIEERRINFGFYLSSARKIMHTIEGDPKLF